MTVIFPVVTEAQREVLGVAIAFSVLAVSAVFLRLLAHHLARKPWTGSDYAIIVACLFAVGLQSISITGVYRGGIGYGHVTEIAVLYGAEPVMKLMQLIIPLQVLWVLSLSCTKISILLLYLRIFPVTWTVRLSWATMGVTVCWAIATILAGFLICKPLAYNWDQSIPGGHCGDQVSSFTGTGVINLVTDLVVLGIPMPSLYKLQMATYKKVTFIAVFALGLITCIISALRISVLSTMSFSDITYTIPRANIFSGVEPCLAITLASVPMMRPLLGRSTYKPELTARQLSNLPRRSAPLSNPDGAGFQPLHDGSGSKLSLEPLAPKSHVEASVQDMNHERYP